MPLFLIVQELHSYWMFLQRTAKSKSAQVPSHTSNNLCIQQDLGMTTFEVWLNQSLATGFYFAPTSNHHLFLLFICNAAFCGVEWCLCSREWLFMALTSSCVCLLVCLTVCLTTWCRARYQILIPSPSKCVCPWVWLTGCSRFSYGTAAEHWETTGTGGLQPYKGLNSNVFLWSLPSLFPLLFLSCRIGRAYVYKFLILLPRISKCFIVPFFLLLLFSCLVFFFSSLASSWMCGWHTSR